MTAHLDTRERVAAGFILAVMAIACVGWWIGVPALTLWGVAHVTEHGPTHFVTGLVGVPAAMAITAPVLLWLNALYLRVTGVLARLEEDEEESDWHRRLRGPLEPMMFVSLAVAFTALCIWFFFIAHTAPSSVL